jgi:hypothetical protein
MRKPGGRNVSNARMDASSRVFPPRTPSPRGFALRFAARRVLSLGFPLRLVAACNPMFPKVSSQNPLQMQPDGGNPHIVMTRFKSPERKNDARSSRGANRPFTCVTIANQPISGREGIGELTGDAPRSPRSFPCRLFSQSAR